MSLSKALHHNCFSSPRGINGTCGGGGLILCLIKFLERLGSRPPRAVYSILGLHHTAAVDIIGSDSLHNVLRAMCPSWGFITQLQLCLVFNVSILGLHHTATVDIGSDSSQGLLVNVLRSSLPSLRFFRNKIKIKSKNDAMKSAPAVKKGAT